MTDTKKSSSLALLIGMIMFSFYSSAHTQIAAPVISAMVADLKITNTTAIGMISTLPSLTCIPTVLVCGKLCEKMNKKKVWLIGTIIWLIGGLGAIAFSSIGAVLACRAVLGVGCGLVIPLVTAIPMDYYSGPKAAAQIGINTGIAGIWGTVLGIAAGALVANGWRASFLVHLLAIPVCIVGMICVPSHPTVTAEASAAEGESKAKERINPQVFKYAVLICVSMLPIMACWSYASMFIAERGLATDTQAATAISLITIFSAVSSLLYGKIASICKKYTLTVSVLCIALAFVFLLLFNSYLTVVIGLAFLGVSMGLVVPYMLSGAAMSASISTQTMAQSIVLCGIYIGQFLSSIWYTLATSIMGSSDATSVFTFNMWFCIAFTAVVLLAAVFKKKPSAA